MPRIVRDLILFISVFILFLGGASAAEVDLIYNLSGEHAAASRDAWHGASIAAQSLKERGHPLNLVLYNGQSRQTINHAIAVMRSKSKNVPILIGLGSPNLIEEAARPLLKAHKIFISASSLSEEQTQALGANFFTVADSTQARAARLLAFINQKFKSNTLLVVANRDASTSVNDLNAILAAKQGQTHQIIPIKLSGKETLVDPVQAKLDQFPNSVIVLTDPAVNAQWLAALRNQGVTVPVVVQTMTHIDAQQKQWAKHFQSAFFITPTHHAQNSILLRHFSARYKQKYGTEPSAAAYNGYNAVMLAASGLQAVKEKDSVQRLSQAMRKVLLNPAAIESPLLTADAHAMRVIDTHNTQVAIG